MAIWKTPFYFSIFRFLISMQSTPALNPFIGATLRGGFGMALKRLACIQIQATCDTCLLHSSCIYINIFESPLHANGIGKSGSHAPHAFIIEPPLNVKPSSESSKLSFNLILIGKGINYLPYFILSFKHLGEIGIGAGRQKFEIASVENRISTARYLKIYDGGSFLMNRKPKIITDSAVKKEVRLLVESKIFLRFLTPARIVDMGKLTRELSFHLLLKNLFRRLSWLAETYCDKKWELDYTGLLDKAKSSVNLTHSDLQWLDLSRYSSRQKTRLKMGGLVGRITFEGDLKPFLPFIKMGEYLHIGQGTVFGLGKYIIE